MAAPAHSSRPTLRPEEWSGLITRAEALGVAGHLHAFLAGVPGRGGVPEPDWGRLQALYYAQAARTGALLDALREILASLAEQSIPVIALKGAALAETVYRNVAVRPMRDVDLLVRPEHAARAAETLERLGFSPDEWYRPREWYLEHLHHLVPYRRDRAVVEIHHRLLPPRIPLAVPLDDLWDRSVPATVASVPARVLAPDDQMLHLCLHLALSDGFLGALAGLRDIAETARHHEHAIDWERLAASTGTLARPVRAALELSARLVNAPLPAAAFEALVHGAFGPAERRAILSLARRVLLCPRSDDSGLVPPWVLRSCLGQVVETRGWGGRVRGVVGNAMATATRRGRALGLGRTAPLYGLFVHPWRALIRRARQPRS
jgi:hypothetical protein